MQSKCLSDLLMGKCPFQLLHRLMECKKEASIQLFYCKSDLYMYNEYSLKK